MCLTDNVLLPTGVPGEIHELGVGGERHRDPQPSARQSDALPADQETGATRGEQLLRATRQNRADVRMIDNCVLFKCSLLCVCVLVRVTCVVAVAVSSVKELSRVWHVHAHTYTSVGITLLLNQRVSLVSVGWNSARARVRPLKRTHTHEFDRYLHLLSFTYGSSAVCCSILSNVHHRTLLTLIQTCTRPAQRQDTNTTAKISAARKNIAHMEHTNTTYILYYVKSHTPSNNIYTL